MQEHWESGLEDIRRSFGHPKWFEIPSAEIGFVTHDVHRRENRPGGASMPEASRAAEESRID
jgi:NTE family protein